jgi:methyl-accepting chemotaxis protein
MARESTTDMRWTGTGALPGTAPDRSGHGEPIPPPRSGTLLNGLLVLLCIVLSAAVGMTIKSIIDLNNEATKRLIVGDIRAATGASKNPSGAPPEIRTLSRYRDRLLILLGLIIVCFTAGGYLLALRRRIPLQTVAEGARQIAGGNLDVAVPTDRTDVLGVLGRAVNDIAANYQEVFLLTGTKAGKCGSAVERLTQLLEHGEKPGSGEEMSRQLELLDRELGEICEIIGSFDFYQVHFDGNKVFRESAAKKEGKDVA